MYTFYFLLAFVFFVIYFDQNYKIESVIDFTLSSNTFNLSLFLKSNWFIIGDAQKAN